MGFKTVARVVNGEGSVAPATAARVEAALRELNYVPDDFAGSLKKDGGRTRTIGMTISNVANPLAAKFTAASSSSRCPARSLPSR